MKKAMITTLVMFMIILGVSSSQKTLATCGGECEDNVTICHATGSDSNPYVSITVDPNAIDGNGNGSSDHNRDDHQDGEDIIPPGSWDADGRNWTSEGEEIWENDCEVPDDGEEPSPSPSPSPRVSPEPSPEPSPSPESSPEPEQQVTFSASGPACSNNFSTKLEVKVGGQGVSGIKVKFSYKSETKEATTNNDGVAGVDFEFKGNGEVTASADGYPSKTVGVQQNTDCPAGGGTPEVLGAATTEGQVLGAMAETGSPIADLFNLVFGLGAGLIGAGVNVYTKKNR